MEKTLPLSSWHENGPVANDALNAYMSSVDTVSTEVNRRGKNKSIYNLAGYCLCVPLLKWQTIYVTTKINVII